ncbi:MAG: hypothetical protein AB7I18_04905 [Candidatus Berkiella sp.]
MIGRHLKKLPEKSYKVAPGDVIGGLVYVMDKPLGIEEGMVGISIDSKGYRDFIKEQIALLETVRQDPGQQHLTSPELQDRYNKIYRNRRNNFYSAPIETQIDLLMKDKKHEKKRHGPSWKEFKNVFFSFGKYHEMKGLQTYYVNKGAGGLLFDAYKKKCGIKEKEHFASHINKLTKNNNKAYMIKQDGQLVMGGTGPGWQKILKTTTGKKLQRLVNPFVIVLTGGLSALVFGVALGLWRRHYLKNNTPTSVNADAIVETLSTKLAQIKGFKSQEIDTIEGTYTNGAPKVVTAVSWMPGCRDLSDKLAGGKDNYESVIIAWDKHEVPYKQAQIDGIDYVIRSKGKDKKGHITGYEKVAPDGKVSPATLEQYQAGKAVSNDSIGGLGESLLSFITMADRDGIGKIGQNKAILPLNPPQGNMTHQFFGIDFGKSFKGPNPIVGSLRDDFTFDNPNGIRERFVNYSALYDNPLREKMKGVYLLAALRDQLTPFEKERIAAEYQAGNDQAFADKLRGYPASVGGVNADTALIDAEKRKYIALANDPARKDQKDEYLQYAERLDEVSKIAKNTDKAIMKTFEKRMHLTPVQIDLLDNIEKLTAKNAHTLSIDGKVQLNHIRVDRADRVEWQLQKNPNGTFDLTCEERQNIPAIRERLNKLNDPEITPLLQQIALDGKKLSLKNISEADLNKLCQRLSEQKVADARGVEYRSLEQRNAFHHRLKPAENKKPKASLPIDIPKSKFHSEPVERMQPMHPPLSHQFNLHVPVSSLGLEAVLVQLGSLKKVEEYLDHEKNKADCEVTGPVQRTKIGVLNPQNALVIPLKNPRTNNKLEIFAQESLYNEVRFSVDKDSGERDFIHAVKAICRLAIQNAASNSTFDLSVAAPDKKPLINEIFEEVLKEELSKGQIHFAPEAAPRLVDTGLKGPDHQHRTSTNL